MDPINRLNCEFCNSSTPYEDCRMSYVNSFYMDQHYTHLWTICSQCFKQFQELTHTKQIRDDTYAFDSQNAQEYASFAITAEIKNLEKLLKTHDKRGIHRDIQVTHEHLDNLGALFKLE
jgi:hypothetical protein